MAGRFTLHRHLVVCAITTAALAVITACGGTSTPSASGASGGSSLPATVKIVSIRDESGPIASFGKAAENGTKVAIQEINDSKFLGRTTLEVDYKDTTGVAQTAASLANQAVTGDTYAAMLGPISSDQAVAVAPIAQRAKMPVVFTQAGSDGVVIGNYTVRATAPQSTIFERTTRYLQSKGATKLAVVYSTGNPTNEGLGTKTTPALAGKYGYSVVSSTAVPGTTLDFSAPVSKILSSGADSVALFLVGPQFAPAVKLLRQNGFKGTIVAASAAGNGSLASIGALAADVVYSTDFNPVDPAQGAQHFVTLYKAMFNQTPSNLAAEAYDATWMIARALKDQNKDSHAAVQVGLSNVAKAGFSGALGKITFDGNDMRVAGVLTQWDGTKEILLGSS